MMTLVPMRGWLLVTALVAAAEVVFSGFCWVRGLLSFPRATSTQSCAVSRLSSTLAWLQARVVQKMAMMRAAVFFPIMGEFCSLDTRGGNTGGGQFRGRTKWLLFTVGGLTTRSNVTEGHGLSRVPHSRFRESHSN